MALQEVEWAGQGGGGGTDWIDLTQDRDRWQSLINAVMNFVVPDPDVILDLFSLRA